MHFGYTLTGNEPEVDRKWERKYGKRRVKFKGISVSNQKGKKGDEEEEESQETQTERKEGRNTRFDDMMENYTRKQ